MAKKVIWALISVEVDNAETWDEETLMDFIHDELVEYGYIVDDMGMREEEGKE